MKSENSRRNVKNTVDRSSENTADALWSVAFLGDSGRGKSCACNMMCRIFSGNRRMRRQAVGPGNKRTSHFVERIPIKEGDETLMFLLDFPGLNHGILQQDFFWDALKDGVPKQAFLDLDIVGQSIDQFAARLQEVFLESSPENKVDAIFLFVRPGADDNAIQQVPRDACGFFERCCAAFGSVYTEPRPYVVTKTAREYKTLVMKAIKALNSRTPQTSGSCSRT